MTCLRKTKMFLTHVLVKNKQNMEKERYLHNIHSLNCPTPDKPALNKGEEQCPFRNFIFIR